MERDDLFYIAGLLDTAAYITIKKIRGEVTGPLISLRVAAGERGQELIRKEYGGYLNRESLVINQGRVWRLMLEVGPYMRNKKEHIEVLKDFYESVLEFKNYKRGKNPKTGLPERMRKERERLWKRMQVLNNGEEQVIDGGES